MIWTRQEINQYLLNTYGRFETKPRFRIVWSEDMTELRRPARGPFDLFDAPMALQKKYGYISNRWILEMAVPFVHPDVGSNEQISYEPMYVFQDKHDQPLEVEKWPLDFACTQILKALTGEIKKKSAQTLKDEAELEKAERIAQIEEEIAHEAPNLAYGGGVVVPRNYGD